MPLPFSSKPIGSNMPLPFSSKPIGFGFSDITDVVADFGTGVVHFGLEGVRAGQAALSGDFDRAGQKLGSGFDTLLQGAERAYDIASDVYDYATDAKNALSPNSDAAIAQNSSLSFRDALEINRRAQQKSDNAFLLIAAGIAAKFLLF